MAEIPVLGLTPWKAVACAPQHWTGSRPEVALHSSSAAQRTSLSPGAQRQLCSDRGENICPTICGRMTPCLSARARVAEGWVRVHNCPRSSEHRRGLRASLDKGAAVQALYPSDPAMSRLDKGSLHLAPSLRIQKGRWLEA